MEETTEIRKMDAALKFELINLLDIDDSWKSIMTRATVDCDLTKIRKYTVEDVKLIEMAGHTQRRSCSEIFLEEWGTSGKLRPNLKILKDLLYDANLIRAATCVASKISNDKSTNGLTVSNEFDNYTDNFYTEDLKSTLCTHNNTSIDNIEHNEWFDEIKLPYQYLFEATNGFSESCLIGTGGFSKVFKSRLNLKQNNQIVAIKRLEHDFNNKDFEQYLNEIRIVLKFKHDNVLPLLAISYDEQPCFIYEFIENGSLLENIACDNRSILLDWKLRIQIGTEIAQGIVYLHTEFETPFIHRDIKTANILLDSKFIPKIGDFGLIRIGNHTMTSVACGTSAYMSPEAFRGDISVKVDVFSFGIVLLELLTGLAPMDKSRSGYDLLTHINEIEWPVEKLLDKRAGNWDDNIARKIYDLAQICCTAKKSQRPVMHGQDGVLESLKNIQSKNDV